MQALFCTSLYLVVLIFWLFSVTHVYNRYSLTFNTGDMSLFCHTRKYQFVIQNTTFFTAYSWRAVFFEGFTLSSSSKDNATFELVMMVLSSKYHHKRVDFSPCLCFYTFYTFYTVAGLLPCLRDYRPSSFLRYNFRFSCCTYFFIRSDITSHGSFFTSNARTFHSFSSDHFTAEFTFTSCQERSSFLLFWFHFRLPTSSTPYGARTACLFSFYSLNPRNKVAWRTDINQATFPILSFLYRPKA